MIGRWQGDNNHVFVRDIMRDFCLVHEIITAQYKRFNSSGTISYAVLRELLGESMRKGVFWRLKDTTHHLFRKKYIDDVDIHYKNNELHLLESYSACILQGQCDNCFDAHLKEVIDWSIGYAFHECVKLKEDAFQRQHYTNRLLSLQKHDEGTHGKHKHTYLLDQLMPFTTQTEESISREINRILGVLEHVRKLLILYLRSQGDNGLLARLLVQNEILIKNCFAEQWSELLSALYGSSEEKMYVLAVTICLESGHDQEAMNLVEKAIENGFDTSSFLHLTASKSA